MNPFHSLWIKLLLAFVLVVAVALGTIAILSNRATTEQFHIYVSQGKQLRAERLAPALVAYYAQVGSWDGVADWLAVLQVQGTGGQGQGRGMGRADDRLLLAGAGGQVIADTRGELLGRRLSGAELALGVPIIVGGQSVGTLIIPASEAIHASQESEFLDQVNRSLLWAGLIAGAVAVGLGLVFARQLTAPLRALTSATQQLARQDQARTPDHTVPQVEIRTQDEIGELGHSFNTMAQSLARQETLRRNLMADIAHELRTPLTVIRSDLEALLDGVYEPTPEALGSLQEEALLLSRLVDDLRALAQAEAGELLLARQSVDLVILAEGVVANFSQEAEVHRVELSTRVPDNLPLVQADPQRVRQVIANLVSNALRHASQPGSWVVVSARPQPGQVQVSVEDNGKGIPPEDLPHVFDRFWRGEKARAGGSGLGLAISREIVRAHGGRIWVESTPGHGTAFHFTLPIHQA